MTQKREDEMRSNTTIRYWLLKRVAGVKRALLASCALTVVAGVAIPQARAEDYENMLKLARSVTPPEYAGPTVPAKAPKGINVAVVTCISVARGCVSPGEGLAHAGEKLGWNVKIYDGGGTPSKQNAAILDAVSSHVDLIATIAIDPNLIQLSLREAAKAGIPVIGGSNGIDSPNPIRAPAPNNLGFALDVSPDYGMLGLRTAQWMIADSKGKANVAFALAKEYQSNMADAAGLEKGFKDCGGCKVAEPLYFTSSQFGQLGQMTVDYLRAHPDVTYIHGGGDPPAAAMVAAIAQAGMADRVKILGTNGDQQNINLMLQGRVQVADGAYDNEYMGWAIADQAIRLFNKQPLFEPHGENLPFVVLDKTNLPPKGADWHADTGYQDKFLKLWK
jgi:ABC-type sugar transport system substrate-binding protein